MTTSTKKPNVNLDADTIQRLLQGDVDEATRAAYQALLREPVPEELVELVKCLLRPKTQHH